MEEAATPATESAQRFPTFRWGLASALVLWLAQPPVAWWPLAWVAPLGWLLIARRESPLDRGDWLGVYLSGVIYWLLAVHWIRLPHPLTIIGWPLLCLYLGCYPLAFVWLCRVGRQKARVPLWLIAPVVWTGLEYLQTHLFTGFLMGSVSHSQASQLWLTPIAATLGAYGVSFVVLLWCGFLFSAISDKRGRTLAWTALALLTLSLPWAIANSAPVGLSSAVRVSRAADTREFTVALIQGNTLATWDPDPQRSQKIMDAQVRLSLEALERAEADGRELDLIIWPESMFRVGLDTFQGAFQPPPGTNEGLIKSSEHCRAWFRSLVAKLNTSLLVGIDHYDWMPDPESPTGLPKASAHNSAVLVDAEGELVSVYDKTHRVPFGEYIPLAEGMPAMYYLTPMSGGLKPGEGPVAMTLSTKTSEQVQLATSICFESTVPHVIRSHVNQLTEEGAAPDLLVNVTNDAWFWGSSELDTHLACGVYRAVETGTPLVVAANGGLSAVISARGEVLAVSPRMEEHVLIVDVPLRRNDRPTPYLRHGDWFAGGCLALSALLAITGVSTQIASWRRLKAETGMPKVEYL